MTATPAGRRPPAVLPLFATAAALPRDPEDHDCHTLGEVFDSLLYCANNGEDLRPQLRRLAELTSNVPVPQAIVEDDGIED